MACAMASYSDAFKDKFDNTVRSEKGGRNTEEQVGGGRVPVVPPQTPHPSSGTQADRTLPGKNSYFRSSVQTSHL